MYYNIKNTNMSMADVNIELEKNKLKYKYMLRYFIYKWRVFWVQIKKILVDLGFYSFFFNIEIFIRLNYLAFF